MFFKHYIIHGKIFRAFPPHVPFPAFPRNNFLEAILLLVFSSQTVSFHVPQTQLSMKLHSLIVRIQENDLSRMNLLKTFLYLSVSNIN